MAMCGDTLDAIQQLQQQQQLRVADVVDSDKFAIKMKSNRHIIDKIKKTAVAPTSTSTPATTSSSNGGGAGEQVSSSSSGSERQVPAQHTTTSDTLSDLTCTSNMHVKGDDDDEASRRLSTYKEDDMQRKQRLKENLNQLLIEYKHEEEAHLRKYSKFASHSNINPCAPSSSSSSSSSGRAISSSNIHHHRVSLDNYSAASNAVAQHAINSAFRPVHVASNPTSAKLDSTGACLSYIIIYL